MAFVPRSTVFSVLVLFIVILSAYETGLPQEGPYQDKYGNKVDKDSKITYAKFRPSRRYTLSAEIFTEGVLVGFYELAWRIADSGFVSEYPYEPVLTIARDEDVESGMAALPDYGPGWALGIVCGLLLVLLLFLGFLACLLALCGCCKPNPSEVKSAGDFVKLCYRVVALSLMAVVGALVAIRIRGDVSDTFTQLIDNVDNSMHDIHLYANTLVDHINFIFVKVNFTKDVFLRDLDNSGTLLGAFVKASIDAQTAGVGGPLIDLFLAQDRRITEAAEAADRLNESYSLFKMKSLQLERSLPPGIHHPQSHVDVLEKLATDIDNTTTRLRSLVQLNISRQTQLEREAEESARPQVKKARKEFLAKLKDVEVVQEIVEDARDQMLLQLPNTSSIKQKLQEARSISNEAYYLLLYIGIVGLLCSLLAFGATLVALMLGKCCTPALARMTLTASTKIFMFHGWFMMAVAAALWLVGPLLTKVVCEPMLEPSFSILDRLLDEYIEQPQSSWLAESLPELNNTPFTAGKLLSACRSDSSMLVAFGLDKKYKQNITDAFNIEDKLDIASLKNITPGTAADQNVSKFTDDLQEAISGAHLDKLDDVFAGINNITGTLANLTGTEFADVRKKAEDLQEPMDDVRSKKITLMRFVDVFTGGKSYAEIEEKAKEDAKTNYTDRLKGIVIRLRDELEKDAMEEFGRCKPLYNVFHYFFVVDLCYNMVRLKNGAWLSVGWVVVFLMLIVHPARRIVLYLQGDASGDDGKVVETKLPPASTNVDVDNLREEPRMEKPRLEKPRMEKPRMEEPRIEKLPPPPPQPHTLTTPESSSHSSSELSPPAWETLASQPTTSEDEESSEETPEPSASVVSVVSTPL